MSLLLDHITYTYPGTTHGLHDVSLRVDTGELVAVIGPSGSGKSTLLKLVAGLETGHTGSILLNGENVAGKPMHQRNIGMVFQQYALFPHLSVVDNVAYGLKLRKVPLNERQNRARDLLALTGLAEYAERSISRLSGGQQQRVALARALAIDPLALLLDEPLAALDASIRGHLRDQIRTIQKRFNATTLLVTHDQEEALTMADKVAVLKDGRLLQFSTPEEIYRAPANKAVAEFVGLSTILPATVIARDLIDAGFARLATATGHRQVGQSVFALIRPENIVPTPSSDATNRISGHIGTQRYLGSIYRYDFLADGAALPLLVESHQIAGNAIALPPEHITLLDS
ncbi:ABC transporter ATP-binding protein [Propionivibrio soli]|uniref:ABC transporter ATP-binding protein n=1 Tax=Propionivibrio soli TaxID=2976531 RepID=UPI0021E895D9|nr:ABC transporter ATP-binding protein [Propionivibrio soli]